MPVSSHPSSNGLAWFAVATRPRWEKFVNQALEGKGFEAFLPVYTSRRRWSDRIKVLELPLFAGYLFCRMSLEEKRLPVLTTPGVRQIMGIGKVPIPVPEGEIGAAHLAMLGEFDVAPEVLEADLLRLSEEMRAKGLLEVARSG